MWVQNQELLSGGIGGLCLVLVGVVVGVVGVVVSVVVVGIVSVVV